MAAVVLRHGVFKSLPALALTPKTGYATKAEKKKGLDRRQAPRVEWQAQSIASKGFLRPVKDYTPPNDVEIKLNSIISEHLGSNVPVNTPIGSLDSKFKLLNACFESFNHSVPNSLLHTIETVADVKQYYTTEVSSKTPLDKLQNMDLPPNLHIQFEYHRFHPDSDTMFNGVTAFPESSTLVTGLKYKDKYKGHTQHKTEHRD